MKGCTASNFVCHNIICAYHDPVYMHLGWNILFCLRISIDSCYCRFTCKGGKKMCQFTNQGSCYGVLLFHRERSD